MLIRGSLLTILILGILDFMDFMGILGVIVGMGRAFYILASTLIFLITPRMFLTTARSQPQKLKPNTSQKRCTSD